MIDHNEEEYDHDDEVLTQEKANKRLNLTSFFIISQWTLLRPIAPDGHCNKDNDLSL